MIENGMIDLLVIGGGINGAGIARDAAGRGLKVVLCEKDDLAQGTSSRSGKLIHGGLRYLEYYEFRLVREALIEREVLLKSAPHIIWPMRFVLPHSPEQRPAWLVRLGLFLYDHLGGRKILPASRSLNLKYDPVGQVTKPEFQKAFEYSDCWVDDARLVLLNLLDAQERGASIFTRTKVVSARRREGAWDIELKSHDRRVSHIRAKAIANAAGPWVDDVINAVTGSNTKRRVRLVKGSHIIVKKFWEGSHAYVLQNHDKRLIFVNPYQDNLALIGTTDLPYEGEPEKVAIHPEEIDYLLNAVNRYMTKQLMRDDVMHTYAGIRPLYDDSSQNLSAMTRDYVFNLEGDPPLLSVFGGKITTFRKLAEHAMQKFSPFFPSMPGDWTQSATLPGGEMPNANFQEFFSEFSNAYSWLPPNVALRFARLYGTRAKQLMQNASAIGDLGQHFGAGLYQIEVDFLCQHEWAKTAEDVLFRRTKIGLHFSAAESAALETYLNKKV
jgi:D-erythritol 1-phosphate dehydrogenase